MSRYPPHTKQYKDRLQSAYKPYVQRYIDTYESYTTKVCIDVYIYMSFFREGDRKQLEL